MKKTFQFLSLVAVMLFSTAVISQNSSNTIDKSVVKTLNKTPNLGFGVSEERPLRSAFMMYEQLKQSEVKFDNYEIVVWGMVVKDIKENKELFDFITKYMDDGLTVSICAVALDKLGVTKEDLPKGFKVVDDAYVRIFELQALGYNVLIP
ncbi:hypothetical protein ERX46_06610 [Brumimicrobium glaciale]|uniref:DsrE family protein n=2 Tax=Brumimicrobium glaciale TaxID=200475 RepID=A0A4Q4KPT0_9FLAO|nr:hypothetical protein ERX46_06610 [Brumimicrobium glaciale]